jgi:hypothetical protein
MSVPVGYQQITSLSASTALTVPTTSQQQPVYAIIRPQAQAVRWRDDGTAPTASVGYPLNVGEELKYAGDLRAIRFIEQAASAALNINYYYG